MNKQETIQKLEFHMEQMIKIVATLNERIRKLEQQTNSQNV